MKNKKRFVKFNFNFIMFLISITVVLGFIFYMTFVFYPNLSKNSITITEDIYWDETNLLEYNCSGTLLRDSIVEMYIRENDTIIKCFEKKINKVYEKKEVNEIKTIQPKTLYFDYCEVYGNGWNGSVLMIASKKCLQQHPEWLDENCECIKLNQKDLFGNIKENSYSTDEGVIKLFYEKIQDNSCRYEKSKAIKFLCNYKCSVYSCIDGKYEVEVGR